MATAEPDLAAMPHPPFLVRALHGIAVFSFLLSSVSAFASPPSPTPWSSLSPSQQEALDSIHGQWDQLEPGQQQRLARGAERWQDMTPRQRDRARQRLDEWQALTPEQRQQRKAERREKVQNLSPEERERLDHFNQLPPAQREQLIDQYQHNRELSKAQRQALRDCLRQRRAGETPDCSGN